MLSALVYVALVAAGTGVALVVAVLAGILTLGVSGAIVAGKVMANAPPVLRSFSEICWRRPRLTFGLVGLTLAGTVLGGVAAVGRPARQAAARERARFEAEATARAATYERERARAQAEAARAERQRAEERAAEEQRQRREEQARFDALTPAQHFAVARAAMAQGYDSQARTGGDFATAERHLQAVPAGAGEAAQALRREIQSRRDRAAREEALANRNLQRAARDLTAQNLDREFIRRGVNVDSVRTAGSDGTTLVVRYALCSRVFVDRFVSGNGDDLRRAGFRRVECRSALEEAWIDL